MRDINSETVSITSAYREGRFDDVLAAVECMPETLLDLPCYYLAARIYESGKSSRGVDYGKAMDYYQLLDRESDSTGSAGAEGLARTLFKKDCCANQKLIERYCLRAIDMDGSIPSHFLLAQMYDKCQGRHEDSRRYYWRVFLNGRPYGLRYYARSHMEHGSKVVGVLSHIAATLVSPFFFVINGGAVHPEIR